MACVQHQEPAGEAEPRTASLSADCCVSQARQRGCGILPKRTFDQFRRLRSPIDVKGRELPFTVLGTNDNDGSLPTRGFHFGQADKADKAYLDPKNSRPSYVTFLKTGPFASAHRRCAVAPLVEGRLTL